MSRSFKKIIAWGRSKASRQNRNSMKYKESPKERDYNGDYIGRKNHYRAKYQTLEDYIEYVRCHFNTLTNWNDMYDRRRLEEYLIWLNGREETEDLIREFATILYKKDKSC